MARDVDEVTIEPQEPHVVVVTGMSGAGRSAAAWVSPGEHCLLPQGQRALVS